MKPISGNYGLYAILIVLISHLGLILYNLIFNMRWVDFLYGPFTVVFILLLLLSIMSILIEFKHNWILISLPFIWRLLLPFEVSSGNPLNIGYYRGHLIRAFSILFSGDGGAWLQNVFFEFAASIFLMIILLYLFMKYIKKTKKENYELLFSFLILILFFIFGI